VEKDVICMGAKTFGAFLARVWREQGLTQTELAEQLDVLVGRFFASGRDGISHAGTLEQL
jgi:hypothetical protein